MKTPSKAFKVRVKGSDEERKPPEQKGQKEPGTKHSCIFPAEQLCISPIPSRQLHRGSHTSQHPSQAGLSSYMSLLNQSGPRQDLGATRLPGRVDAQMVEAPTPAGPWAPYTPIAFQ